MIPGFEPCEGQGPRLNAMHFLGAVTAPLIITMEGLRAYIIHFHERGFLLLVPDDDPGALEDFKRAMTAILGGIMVGESPSWQAVPQTSRSFREWADGVTQRWARQQALETAIRQQDPHAVMSAIDVLGADRNLQLPCGEFPMVLAVEMKSTGMIAELRSKPITDAQWDAADVAAKPHPDIAAMIKERHTPVPKPLGDT